MAHECGRVAVRAAQAAGALAVSVKLLVYTETTESRS